MSLVRTPALLLCAALGFAAPALAQDEKEGADAAGEAAEEAGETTEEMEGIVDERAEQEARDGEPAGFDVGEASYNVADCTPGDDADAEGGTDDEAEDDEDDDADGESAVDEDAIEECEEVVK